MPPLVIWERAAVVGAKASDQPADAASNAADAIALKMLITIGRFDSNMLPYKLICFFVAV